MSLCLDRRRSQRYSISLDVHFTIKKQAKILETGIGKIQNVCRSGLLFECPIIIPPASVLQLIIDWPVLFEGKTPVQWVVDGVVVRSTSSGTAVQIMRQKFERSTQKKRQWAG
jgi:hypothetical protein